MSEPVSQRPQQLPESARARLGRTQQGSKPFFTSDLSVNEFVLTTQTGFEPLGLVMGTCIYHVGVQASRWSVSQELQVLSQAMYQCRELAMARMESEADALGADGVIGVRIRSLNYAFASDVLEFVAVGTAIKSSNGQSYRTPAGRPFTSHLSGQDFWTLHRHGWLPRGLVLGTCVYHIAHMTFRQMLSNVGQNVELTNFSQAAYDAREIAMDRMQYEGQLLQADGIVGVSVEESAWEWGQHAIEFFAMGTAVARLHPDAQPEHPTMVMPLT
ncbi:heavy metal-binding domain-containing protein [Dactylosporangium sp. CS-047395]|uniref:heavy metal-binding domain-containing protein n=1 Tax=Dactylosporangium sp. CS-047395 TaxID=3239936 RepID=UPI003D9461B3